MKIVAAAFSFLVAGGAAVAAMCNVVNGDFGSGVLIGALCGLNLCFGLMNLLNGEA